MHVVSNHVDFVTEPTIYPRATKSLREDEMRGRAISKIQKLEKEHPDFTGQERSMVAA